MRKIIACLLVLALTACLFACSPKEDAVTTAPGATAAPETAADGSTAGETDASVTTTDAASDTAAGATYAVAVADISEGGTVTTDKTEVEAGGSFTVTIAPATGYYLYSLQINSSDKTGSVTDNTYTYKGATEDITVKAEFDYGVTYASAAPVIDAIIDDMWANVPKFYANNNYNASSGQSTGYVSVMWNESGFYFLGVITDDSPCKNDRCNFWVCESATDETLGYSQDKDDGRYAVCINPNGENYYVDSLDVTPYWTCRAQPTDTGYIVEIFVPVLGKEPLTAGNFMGFDVSVDSYGFDSESRDAYCNWYGEGAYWSDVSALYQLKLLSAPAAE